MLTACLDGMNLALKTGSGIATYGRTLLTALEAIGVETQVLYAPMAPIGRDPLLNEAIIAGDVVAPPSKIRRLKRISAEFTAPLGRAAMPVPRSGRIAWSPEVAPRPTGAAAWASERVYRHAGRAFRRYGAMTPIDFRVSKTQPVPEVCHWTAPMPVYSRTALNLYTFHDLIPLTLPASTEGDKQSYLALCRAVARRADHILVVSESTRQDVINLLDVAEDRVTNTGQSVAIPAAAQSRPVDEVAQEIEAAFGLSWKSYFLHYGAIEPKKNLARIVEAYLGSGLTSPLILVGAKAWMSEGETRLLKQVQAAGGSGRIHQFDYLPAGLLMSLVRGARATLFPSLTEGFGLPVLESMTLGTPVLTSTTGSLPEIAGGAALLVDPHEVEAIRLGMVRLDADPALRQALVEKGRLRAATFAPAFYAEKLRSLYVRLGLLT